MNQKKNRNKVLFYNHKTLYSGSKFNPRKLNMFMPNQPNPHDLDYAMVNVNPDTVPRRYSFCLSYLLGRLEQQMRDVFTSDSMYYKLSFHKPIIDFKLTPAPLITLWYIFCVLLSSETVFPLPKDFKYVNSKNPIFYCILDEHFLQSPDEPCDCMHRAGIDLLFHWEARNRHFELRPDKNDRRIKYPRQHYYFIWRTPFPGSEELTMSIQFSPMNYLVKSQDIFVHHGPPGLRFYETRSYWVNDVREMFWSFDAKKYRSYNISNARARGDFRA